MSNVGIVGTGIYLPGPRMTAAEIAKATEGIWTEENIIKKLGIVEKPIPGPGDGTQEMGVYAAQDLLKRTGIDPMTIDLIISVGEEWKEYPLTTTAIYIQGKIGADKAWAFDIQQRCGTTVTAMKLAKDMMLSDDTIKRTLIVGGYRNGDLLDYRDPAVSMMYNLSAGGGAILLERDYGKNLLLGSHIMSDGTMARDAGVEIGGTEQPITKENLDQAYQSLRLMNPQHMKDRLNQVSMSNWMHCIEEAFRKSALQISDLDYLAVLHFKRSMHDALVASLGLSPDQTIYLDHYGHMGQIDQILSLHLALEQGKVQDGSIIAMIAAGIGYAWSANVIRWG